MSDQEDTVNNGILVMEDNTDSICTQREQASIDPAPLQNQAHYSHPVSRRDSSSELQNCPVESHPLETAANPEPCAPSGSESRESLVEPEPCALPSSESQESLLGEPEPCALSGSESQESLGEPEPCILLGSESLVEPEPCILLGSESLVEPEPCILLGSESLVEPEPCILLGSESLVEPEPCILLGSESLVEPEPCILLGSESLVEPAVITTSSCAEAAEEPRTVALSTASLSHATQLWVTRRDEAVKLRMENCGPGSESPLTIHQMFREAVETNGDQPALAAKKEGEWVKLTWKEYYEQCRAAAKSFLKLGLQRYHGVGILGFNSPEWFISEIGCILAGGLAAGIYTTNSPEACQYVAENCEANILVVENEKQLAKILEVRDQLPHLKAIVQYKGEPRQKLPDVYTWAEFMEMGKDVPDEQLDIEINNLKANECCILIYTSGTTGTPKGVMLSHDNVTWTANAAGTMTHLRHGEEVVVSYLPLSHVAAQVNDMWIIMRFAGTTYFAEPDALKGSLGTTLKEVRPTSFLGVPRVWEKMQEKMKSIGAKSSTMRKKVADWAKSIGLQYNYSAMNGENLVPWGFMLANNLVFKKVRAALGLDRCTLCFTGAAPITKDTLEYFMSLNLPLMELYGMSESSAPHTVSCPDDYRIMSCGKTMTGCKTKLDKPDADGNGEICFWGRHVFMGYLNMPEKTEEALDQDGWLHSGDLGKHDKHDFLYITGRIKELIITAGGENIPPVPTEDALKAEVAILSNAMLIGDKLKFLSMLLTLKCVVDDNGDPTDELTPEALDFCQKLGVTATKVSQILANKEPAIYKAIQEGLERVNAKAASNAQKVQKWVILENDFSVSGGELGPTMKLKRSVVVKMYQEKINEMYGVPQERP